MMIRLSEEDERMSNEVIEWMVYDMGSREWRLRDDAPEYIKKADEHLTKVYKNAL